MILHESTGPFMSNNRVLRPASCLKRTPGYNIYIHNNLGLLLATWKLQLADVDHCLFLIE